MRYRRIYEKLRPRDVNLFCGVGDEEGYLNLYGKGPGASLKSDNNLKRKGKFKVVPIYRLDRICRKHVEGNGIKDIHFLKIDVEGFERQTLLGCDFKKYRPWIICIEACEPGHDDKSTQGKWEDILFENGYMFAEQIFINRIYVAEEHMNLMERCVDIDRLKEKYDIIPRSSLIKYNRYTASLRELSRILRRIKD